MTPKHAALKAALLGSALTISTVGYAQEIKIGFNGDLSASPSAQSGQAQQGGQSQQSQGQQSQRLSEDQVRNFLNHTAQVLRQAATNRNPEQAAQFLENNMIEDAVVTTVSQLWLGDNLIAQSFTQVPEETLTDALGMAAPAVHGRRIVQDYNVDMSIRDIKIAPNQQSARVVAVINESGRLMAGELASMAMRMHQRMAGSGMQGPMWGSQGQMPMMQGQGGQFGQQGQEGQQSGQFAQQGPQGQSGQFAQQGQQGQTGQFGQQGQSGRFAQQGQGRRWRQLGIGQPEWLRFQGQTTCVMQVTAEEGGIKFGDALCRAVNRLS